MLSEKEISTTSKKKDDLVDLRRRAPMRGAVVQVRDIEANSNRETLIDQYTVSKFKNFQKITLDELTIRDASAVQFRHKTYCSRRYNANQNFFVYRAFYTS